MNVILTELLNNSQCIHNLIHKYYNLPQKEFLSYLKANKDQSNNKKKSESHSNLLKCTSDEENSSNQADSTNKQINVNNNSNDDNNKLACPCLMLIDESSSINTNNNSTDPMVNCNDYDVYQDNPYLNNGEKELKVSDELMNNVDVHLIRTESLLDEENNNNNDCNADYPENLFIPDDAMP
jgi:hypothetical protein